MPIKTIVTRDFEQMSDVAAELVVTKVARLEKERKDPVLGLATGNSPTGLYRRLADAANNGQIDSSCWRTFNLDEYVGLGNGTAGSSSSHPESYRYFMDSNLFNKLSRPPISTVVPDGGIVETDRLVEALESDPAGWRYEGDINGKAVVIDPGATSEYLQWVRTEVLGPYGEAIAAAGGIDLQILGVGGCGHVAFHEAGIPFELPGLLLVELDVVTKEHSVEDGHFPSLEECPRFALTMSVDLVFKARDLLVLANGSRKQAAIGQALLEEPTERMPISYAQVHSDRGGNITFVVDEAAAQDLLKMSSRLAEKGIELEDRRA